MQPKLDITFIRLIALLHLYSNIKNTYKGGGGGETRKLYSNCEMQHLSLLIFS